MHHAFNAKFAIAGQLQFVSSANGLIQGLVSTDHCRGAFYLHGGHVTEFQPRGGQPLLFLSARTELQPQRPIRGGVPLCFPWFGPHASDSTAPAHGLVRTRSWELQASSVDARGRLRVELGLQIEQWQLTYVVHFGTSLDLELEIKNLADEDRECEVALHSYLLLADATIASVQGLEQQPYLDKLTMTKVAPTALAIQFTQETDRVYHGQVADLFVRDPANQRQIRLQPRNSKSTVVWNPWIAKSKRMPDFGDLEYLHMCCVETANVGDDHLCVASQAAATIGVELSTQPL